LPCWAAKWPIFSYGDNDELTLEHPLSAEERANLSRSVKILHISGDAGSEILNDRKLIPKLALVTLTDEPGGRLLEALASNHPHIAALSISQLTSLSEQSASCLQSFPNLKELELHCKLTKPDSLSQYLPKTLERLWISQPCTSLKLPNVGHFTIANCSAEASFFEHLEAPKLEILNLSEASLEEGALSRLDKFSNLKWLYLPVEWAAERDAISKFTHACIYVTGDPIGPPSKLLAPLRPLPEIDDK
jgi:hypothetical protein